MFLAAVTLPQCPCQGWARAGRSASPAFTALQAKQLLQQGLLKLQGERMTQGAEGGPGPDQAQNLIRVLDDMLDLKKAGNE